MTLILSLILAFCRGTGKPPAALIGGNWLQPNRVPITCQRFQVQYGDLDHDGLTNMADWSIFAANYKPVGWTVGGKTHLYRDCRYIVDKQMMPILVDPNNICIVCKARKVSE